MKTKILKIAFLLAIAFIAGKASASTCYFSRDLGVGSRGEDVRCLQSYLVSSGYGYGSADGIFGPMTRQMVISWQSSNGIFPANGYFSSSSRSSYNGSLALNNNGFFGQVLGASTTYGTTYDNTYGNMYDSTYGTTTTPFMTSNEARAKNKIDDAINKIEDAQNEIDDSNTNTSSAKESLDDARSDIFDAVRAFILDRDFNEAYDKASDAYDNARDAFRDAGGRSSSGSRRHANDLIDEVSNRIDDAQDEIDSRENYGQNVRRANNLLDDARDSLDDAQNEYDDENYDDAEDSANDADDLVSEALDALY